MQFGYYGAAINAERHIIEIVTAYCGVPNDAERHTNKLLAAYLISLAFTPIGKAKDEIGKTKDEKGKNFVYNYF